MWSCCGRRNGSVNWGRRQNRFSKNRCRRKLQWATLGCYIRIIPNWRSQFAAHINSVRETLMALDKWILRVANGFAHVAYLLLNKLCLCSQRHFPQFWLVFKCFPVTDIMKGVFGNFGRIRSLHDFSYQKRVENTQIDGQIPKGWAGLAYCILSFLLC